MARARRAPTPTPERTLIRIDDAAHRLSISRAKLYRLIAAKQFPAVRIGKVLRVSLKALQAWADKSQVA